MWEGVLGAERELITGVVLKGTLIYRKFLNQWEDAETNANWNSGGTALDRTTPFKSGRNEFIFDLQTPDEATREYRGATVELRKREGVVRALLSYTLSRFQGSTEALTGTFLDNPGQTKFYYGPLAADNRHDVRAQAVWIAKSWLSLGSAFVFLSGGPLQPAVLRSGLPPVRRLPGPARLRQPGHVDPGRRPGRCGCPTCRSWICRCGSAWSRSSSSASTSGSTPSTSWPCAPPPAVVQTDGPFWGQDADPPATAAVAARSAVPLLRAMGAGARAEVHRSWRSTLLFPADPHAQLGRRRGRAAARRARRIALVQGAGAGHHRAGPAARRPHRPGAGAVGDQRPAQLRAPVRPADAGEVHPRRSGGRAHPQRRCSGRSAIAGRRSGARPPGCWRIWPPGQSAARAQAAQAAPGPLVVAVGAISDQTGRARPQLRLLMRNALIGNLRGVRQVSVV